MLLPRLEKFSSNGDCRKSLYPSSDKKVIAPFHLQLNASTYFYGKEKAMWSDYKAVPLAEGFEAVEWAK
jgi:hypothetical protein